MSPLLLRYVTLNERVKEETAELQQFSKKKQNKLKTGMLLILAKMLCPGGLDYMTTWVQFMADNTLHVPFNLLDAKNMQQYHMIIIINVSD